MHLRILAYTLTALCVGLASSNPAYAQVNLDAANSCILDSFASGQGPDTCIQAAHQECLAEPESMAAAATLCFTRANDTWSQGIAAQMTEIRDRASPDITAIAQIETKYDMLSGLLQCDRVEELAIAVSDQSGPAIQRAKSMCAATTAAYTYAKLLWQTRNMQ